MVKKLIATGAVAATILAMAGGVWASRSHHHSRGNVNVGVVKDNNAIAIANSGLNGQFGGGDQDIETGNALATAGQDILVNTSTCGCPEGRGGRRSSTTNFGWVEGNNAVALANSGANLQVSGGRRNNDANFTTEGEDGHHGRHESSEQEIDTGKADAYAWHTIVVNSSLSEADED